MKQDETARQLNSMRAIGSLVGGFVHWVLYGIPADVTSLPEGGGAWDAVIGHSLGGHNAIFTAVFDERIKAVVRLTWDTLVATRTPAPCSPRGALTHVQPAAILGARSCAAARPAGPAPTMHRS